MKPVYWHTIPLAAGAAAGSLAVVFPIVAPITAAAPPGGPKEEGDWGGSQSAWRLAGIDGVVAGTNKHIRNTLGTH